MQSLWIIIIVLSQPVFGDAVQILISSKFDLFTSSACGIIEFLMLVMSVTEAFSCCCYPSASANSESS
jgi:hypothetical protein